MTFMLHYSRKCIYLKTAGKKENCNNAELQDQMDLILQMYHSGTGYKKLHTHTHTYLYIHKKRSLPIFIVIVALLMG